MEITSVSNIIAISAAIIAVLLILGKFIVPCNGSEGFASGYVNTDTQKSYAGINSGSDNPWTIDRPTKTLAQDILRQILNVINSRINMSYYLQQFDQLKTERISATKVRFVADFFAHEMRDLHTRRMIIVFVVDMATNDVEVEHVNLSNAWKSPSKDFMDYPEPALYLQDDNLLHNEYHIMGINTSKLEHSIFNEKAMKPKEVPTPTEFQKWILPMGIASAYQNPQAMFPSRRQSNCWDTAGVNYVEGVTPTKWGIKNTELTRYPYPYMNPTVTRQREFGETYHWLNDLVQNSSGLGANCVAASP